MIMRSLKIYLKQKWNPDNIARSAGKIALKDWKAVEASSKSPSLRRQNGLPMPAALP